MDRIRRSLLLFAAAASLALPGAVAASQARTIEWEELIPPDWSPNRVWGMLMGRLGAISDYSPEAERLMNKMRHEWDSAPTHDRLAGQLVRLPGYVVALDAERDEMREFLLVPYFGACIHTPPPPANQIIHVVLERPVSDIRSMDAVWVEGVLSEERRNSEMGISGYRMAARKLSPYQ